MLSVMLVCTGCGKKSGSMAEEGTTQSLPTETIQTEQTATVEQTETQAAKTAYKFRNYDLLKSHYKKHGKYMGFDSPEEYLAAANAVIRAWMLHFISPSPLRLYHNVPVRAVQNARESAYAIRFFSRSYCRRHPLFQPPRRNGNR